MSPSILEMLFDGEIELQPRGPKDKKRAALLMHKAKLAHRKAERRQARAMRPRRLKRSGHERIWVRLLKLMEPGKVHRACDLAAGVDGVMVKSVHPYLCGDMQKKLKLVERVELPGGPATPNSRQRKVGYRLTRRGERVLKEILATDGAAGSETRSGGF